MQYTTLEDPVLEEHTKLYSVLTIQVCEGFSYGHPIYYCDVSKAIGECPAKRYDSHCYLLSFEAGVGILRPRITPYDHLSARQRVT